MENLEIIGAEVYAILSKVSIERYNKIPTKITKTFEKYKESAKKVKIKPNVEFDKQEISKEAKDIMFVIALDYWLTDEEKKQAMDNLKFNEEKLKEKYNIEKIFEQRRSTQIDLKTKENLYLQPTRENLLRKFINFIRKLFTK